MLDSPEACRALLDEAQDKVVVLDESGTYRYVNAATRRILGYEPEDLVGDTPFEYVHPDDIERVREKFRAVRDGTADTTGIEYRYRAADGSWVWLDSRMADHSNAAVGGYVVTSRDVTERKAAERARERTESRLQELASNTQEVLWMFSGDWSELLFVNDAFEELYGMSTETVREDPTAFIDAVHPDDRERVETVMARASAGERVEVEYRVNEREEYRRWVWVRGRPIFEDGEVARIAGFSREITDRRRRERQLRVMDRLLRHNLRNELNVVMGRAELAREVGSPAVREHVDAIDRICRDVLETAEKEREIVNILSREGTLQRVDLAGVAREAVRAVSADYPAASIARDLPGEAQVVCVPEFHIAVTELVRNAVEHSDSSAPAVDVSIAFRDGSVVLRVADDGPPIPAEEVAALLGDSEADPLSHGSGLGLWLVRWAVEVSDGDVDVTAGDDGNVVTVTLSGVNGPV